MSSNNLKITHELDFSGLSVSEASLVLGSMESSASYAPKDKVSKYRVKYGRNLEVVYKADGSRIVDVYSNQAYWSGSKNELLRKIALAKSPESEKIITKIVFTRGKEFSIPPFRWEKRFQIGRVPEGNPMPEYPTGHFPCLFQYRTPITGMGWLDQLRMKEYFKKYFYPLIPILKQKASVHLSFPEHSGFEWTIGCEDELHSTRYRQLGYEPVSEFNESAFYGYEEQLKFFPVVTPDFHWLSAGEVSLLYSQYLGLSEDDRKKYILACEWFNKALGQSEATDKFLSIMIMLEIFLSNDSVGCEACGQKKFSIAQNLKTFVPSVIGQSWLDEFDKVLGDLYSLRSGIAHKGIAIAQNSFVMTPKEISQGDQVRLLFDLGRQFLVSWLFYAEDKT